MNIGQTIDPAWVWAGYPQAQKKRPDNAIVRPPVIRTHEQEPPRQKSVAAGRLRKGRPGICNDIRQLLIARGGAMRMLDIRARLPQYTSKRIGSALWGMLGGGQVVQHGTKGRFSFSITAAGRAVAEKVEAS